MYTITYAILREKKSGRRFLIYNRKICTDALCFYCLIDIKEALDMVWGLPYPPLPLRKTVEFFIQGAKINIRFSCKMSVDAKYY